MARIWLTPSSTCILTSSGSADGSEGHYAWFGLTAAHHNAACATFYNSGSATAGRQLWTLTAAASTSTESVGPFSCGYGVYVRLAGTGASAMVAID